MGSGGLLTAKSPKTVNAGDSTAAVMIPPDQGPVALFTDTVAPAGKPTHFNASASHDSGGKVVLYRWRFGDGTSADTTTATVSHTYKKAGKYTITLTVRDDSGCSTKEVFTGQTAYCNGSSAGKASHRISVAAS